MTKFIEILPDIRAIISTAEELLLEKVYAAIAQRDRCTLVLAGGSTPKPLYEAMSHQDLPWDKIHIFWGDERYVPPTHDDSNEKMARDAWLNRVEIPAENIHPMPTGADNPAADAQTYNQTLQSFFGLAAGAFPRFDVVLLGMGDDGHTASLFPHTEALRVVDRLVTVGNKDGQPRLTLTAPTINHARCTMFLVAGANKQPALAQIFDPAGDASAYPSRLIQPIDGELWWLLDAAAGAVIESKTD
jgi:6-phosphogluconolactonase